MDQWFTAYFWKDDFPHGNTAVLFQEDGRFPRSLAWDGGVYILDFPHETAPEAHYIYSHDLP